MSKISSKHIKVLRICIVFGTMLGGFISWLFFPWQVIIQLESGTMGNKLILLIVLLLPLFAMIPSVDMPEFHVDDEYARNEKESCKRNNEIVQLVWAILFLVIVSAIFVFIFLKL